MAAYAVLHSGKHPRPAELETYSEKVGATLSGHPITVLPPMAVRRCSKGRRSRGWSSWSFRQSRRPRRGTTAPPIARSANIASARRVPRGDRRGGVVVPRTIGSRRVGQVRSPTTGPLTLVGLRGLSHPTAWYNCYPRGRLPDERSRLQCF